MDPEQDIFRFPTQVKFKKNFSWKQLNAVIFVIMCIMLLFRSGSGFVVGPVSPILYFNNSIRIQLLSDDTYGTEV